MNFVQPSSNQLRRSLVGSALLCCSVASSSAASAETLYGVTGTQGSNSTLYKIDPSTGAALARIGTLGTTTGGGVGYSVTGLRRHPVTGIMYGVTCASSGPILTDGGPSISYLVTIDLATGIGTPVGPLGTNRGQPVADIAFGPNGTLYGWWEGPDALATIDTATGLATVVQDVGLSTYGSGLAFDAVGNLIYAGTGEQGSLLIMDRVAATPLASIGIQGGQDRSIGSLAVSHAGKLYGVSISSGVSSLISFDFALADAGGTVVIDSGADGGDAGVFPANVGLNHIADTEYGGFDGGSDADAASNVKAIALAAIAFNIDLDDDGVLDSADNCVSVANPTQTDSNGNGIGDACDPTSDGGAGEGGTNEGGLPMNDGGGTGTDGGGSDSGSGTGDDAGRGNADDSGASSGCGCGVVGMNAAGGTSALVFLAFAGLASRRRRSRG